MGNTLILFNVWFFINTINLVENICDENTMKSDIGQEVCNNYCYIEYDILEKNINCSNMSIRDILSHIDRQEIEATYPITLTVTDADDPVLSTSIFKNINKLSILYLKNSRITKIMPGAFNFLDNLKELYLEGNQLTTISEGTFNSLTSLESLDLSRNMIQNISYHAFLGLENLNELNIKQNNISIVPQIVLNSLSNLTSLDISRNNLNEVPNFNILQLTSLNLAYNKIEVVDFELFNETLAQINLSFNNISEIINFNASEASLILLKHNNVKYFDKNMNVQTLDLSYNNLEAIGSNLFGDRLKGFDAGNNLISSINSDAFFGLYDLEDLLLNDNNLSFIPNSCFKDLHSLTYLDLSSNKLTSFTFGTFDNLLSLEVLNISYNHLKTLNQNTFHSLGNLTDLVFQNNEISEINVFDLKIHMPQLKTINLDDNIWSCNKLVAIVQRLNTFKMSFLKGNYSQESNIHGIKCFETSDRTTEDADLPSKTDSDLGYSKLNSFFNEDFTKTIMYKYFNKEFKNSNFFKYLESLINNTSSSPQNINTRYFEKLLKELNINFTDLYNKDFAKSDMFNYFNKNFKNSTFFKYLESSKNKAIVEDASEKLIDSKLEQVLRSFKEVIENNFNKSLKQDIYQSDAYKYIKEDIQHFFQHLESLNNRSVHNNYENFMGGRVQKFISGPEVGDTLTTPNYTALLSFILIFLIIITCVMIVQAYTSNVSKKKCGPSKKEEVELL